MLRGPRARRRNGLRVIDWDGSEPTRKRAAVDSMCGQDNARNNEDKEFTIDQSIALVREGPIDRGKAMISNNSAMDQ
jgi:hypothetical protein